jgi:hypothetical protein
MLSHRRNKSRHKNPKMGISIAETRLNHVY